MYLFHLCMCVLCLCATDSKTKPGLWSSLMSPSVHSQYPEQVVPNQQYGSSPDDSARPAEVGARRQVGQAPPGRMASQTGRKEVPLRLTTAFIF